MIDRITTIKGTRRLLKPPAHLTAEYDVPQQAWFLLENSYPGVPLSILLEIALQPCGILSAFLGTSLVLPPENNRFRNLDGELHFHQAPQLPGNTITNKVTLLDAVTSGGMHIQKYAFELFVNGSVFLTGNSSFGYFTRMAMQQQAGLGEQESRFQSNHIDTLSLNRHLKSSKRFNLVDEVQLFEGAGRYGNGLITGKKQLNGSEWFYSNHFYKDPVMPGSLGLEAIMYGVWAFISHHGYDRRFTDPILDYSYPKPFTWKYRGQVIPANRSINFQTHIKESSIKDNAIFLSVDAGFWVDGMRIYEFKDLSFSIKGGNQ
jgi:3-hydroxymyristoyl/3-hydroxydecanoyl-(acyl carrier protein) dehydratase